MFHQSQLLLCRDTNREMLTLMLVEWQGSKNKRWIKVTLFFFVCLFFIFLYFYFLYICKKNEKKNKQINSKIWHKNTNKKTNPNIKHKWPHKTWRNNTFLSLGARLSDRMTSNKYKTPTTPINTEYTACGVVL